MYKYQMVIYWSNDDQCYIVEVPELNECMADGETPYKAIENAQVIIQEWIETAKKMGMEIPEPKGKLITA